MASVDPRVLDLIVRGGRQRGISPAALVAVALGEGGLRFGSVGDAGTSFGPFQLRGNDAPGGGASPFGVAGTRQRASSPFIVNNPLNQIASLGIGNMSPAQQVINIIRRFERPADPDASVRNALERLKTVVPGILGGEFDATDSGGQFGGGGGGGGGAALMQPAVDQRRQVALQTLQTLAKGDQVNPVDTLTQLAEQQRQQQLVSAELAEGPQKKRAPSPDKISGASNKEWSQLRGIGNSTPDFMLAAIKKARSLGLAARENPAAGDAVDPVHTEGSFHDKFFPGTQIGRALDVSGDPAAMDAFFRWAIRFRPTELFYDPLGQYDNGRYSPSGIGGHGGHVHLSV